MTNSTKPTRAAILALFFAGSLPWIATRAEADGTFFQFDLTTRSSDAVLSATRGKLSFGANYSAYETGWSAGLHVTRDFVIPDLATIKIGPSLSGNHADRGVALGGKILVERYQPTDFGFVFLSGQYNTIQNDWFALAQIGNGRGLLVDLGAGGSDTYSEQFVAVNYRLGDGPAGLRAGYRFEAEEVFVGMSVNTY
ncbi:hypothetical protein [Mameliella sp.]|uniref:hypothetical protein n=1 Tax=Mameliella sp. TaxID=1924940 RepID=UPI003BABC871